MKPLSQPEWKAERDDAEVVRLALVLNGGVSLAVWIGGVTHELDRLRRAFEMEQESAYAQMLRCLGCVVRIDVIGGASAGGLNGAMLASAIAYGRSLADATPIEVKEHAEPGSPAQAEAEANSEAREGSGADTDDGDQVWMRGQWLDLGDLAIIMRKPSNVNTGPSSLIDGNRGMFEPLRDKVFAKLVPNAGPTSSETRQPVVYVATTTDVAGEPVRRFDDYGAEFRDREHRAMLQFTSDPENLWATSTDDDFALRHVPGGPSLASRRADVRAKLALAARSTSSFPVAFEPAHWDAGTDVASFSSPRYLADGGIFDNAPFGRVIDAIRERRATRLTHRVLAYVCAYDNPLAVEMVDFSSPPSISAIIDLTLNKPRDVSMTTGLARLDEMRHGQDDRLRPRDELVIAIASGDVLTGLASDLFAGYQLSRLELVLDRIVALAQSELGSMDPSLNRNIDRALALDAAIDASAVPLKFDVQGEWRWGITAAKRGIDVLTDALLYALRLTPRDASGADARTSLRASRERLSHLWNQLDRLGDEIDQAETVAFGETAAASAPDWIQRVFEARGAVIAAWPGDRKLALGPAPAARRTPRKILIQAIGEVRAQRPLLDAVADAGDNEFDAARARYVTAIAGLLGDVPVVAESAASLAADEKVLKAIASLDVLSVALGATAATDTPRFEVKRMTARAYGPDGLRHEPGDKLAGLQLGHFGGFLKRSWRANDWMWGRVDAVDHITQLLLAPARLRRAKHPEKLGALLAGLAGIPADSEQASAVTACLVELAGGAGGLTGTAAQLAGASRQATIEAFRIEVLVPALQREIIAKEIPAIQEARRRDRERDGRPPAVPDAACTAPAAPAPGELSPAAVDAAVAGLSGLDPGEAAMRLMTTLARETVGANFPGQSITRPTGNALATGLQALSAPSNRLPGAARKPLAALMPFPVLFYGLSQTPTDANLRRILRKGGMWIAFLLALGALLFTPVWWLAGKATRAVLDDPPRLVAWLVPGVVILVIAIVVGMLIAARLSEAVLQALKGRKPKLGLLGGLGFLGMVITGAWGWIGAIWWLRHRGTTTRFQPYEEPPEE
jgi:patatin-related protein